MPADGTAGQAVVTAFRRRTWRKAATAAVEGFADPRPVTPPPTWHRSSLAFRRRQIATTVDGFAAARDLTGADPHHRDGPGRAATHRRVLTWSVGATALDAVNVDAGYGRRHVFLPTSSGEGELAPDTEPEGSHDS